MYQVGQAVIYWGNRIAFFHTKYDPHYGYTLQDFNGKLSYYHSIDRPATEAEILAEAVKHGWVKDENGNYDQKTKAVWIFFHPDLERYVINSDPYEVEDYSIFGQECITAHRLITALNLAK